MKRLSFSIMLLLLIGRIDAGEYPIIFLHGIQKDPRPEAGWETWKNPYSAMKRIVKESYGGYRMGITSDGEEAYECNKTTELKEMPDTNKGEGCFESLRYHREKDKNTHRQREGTRSL